MFNTKLEAITEGLRKSFRNTDCKMANRIGKIATALENQGILSPTGKAKWYREAISKLLSNEKYTGSVLLQKTLSFAGVQFENNGELDQVLIKGHHEAIVSAADFEEVQQMKSERSKSQVQDSGVKMSF